jgi:glutaminyl-tRNA synthetase
VKGTIQWVSAEDGVKAEIRLYDHLFTVENPDKVEDGKDFTDNINPDSLQVVTDAIVEPALADLEPGTTAQFIRLGYFCKDRDSKPGKPVFNRTISLKDGWAKTLAKS